MSVCFSLSSDIFLNEEVIRSVIWGVKTLTKVQEDLKDESRGFKGGFKG